MSQKKLARVGLAVLGLAAAVSLMSADANAKGCNGYVNQWEWGCAPWDNNNGPQYPHYKKPEAQPAKVAPAPARVAPSAPPSTLVNRSAAPLVSTNGGNLINHDGASLVGNSGGTVISQDNAGFRKK